VREPAIALEELRRRLAAEFPEAFGADSSLSILRIGYGSAELRHAFRPESLRPGGTISGASMMLLADATMYVAVLASIGWVPLAVTTNLSIAQARQALGSRRSLDPPARRGRSHRACDVDLFDSTREGEPRRWW
jgi:acyl-coenzyme A thioesterase PaaI-like protein